MLFYFLSILKHFAATAIIMQATVETTNGETMWSKL